jgi:hypothetical protein
VSSTAVHHSWRAVRRVIAHMTMQPPPGHVVHRSNIPKWFVTDESMVHTCRNVNVCFGSPSLSQSSLKS